MKSTTADPTELPFGPGLPEGHADIEIVPSATKEEIDKSAKEGRLSIRAADLSPKIIEALAVKFGPDTIAQKLEHCLNATKTVTVNRKPLEVEDFKTQLDALKLLLQYQVGNPVSRSEVVTHNVDTMQTLENKMQKSPALRRAVGAMLDRSEGDEGESRDVTPSEEKVAEEALQSLPEHKDTPIETEVKRRTMSQELRSRSKLDLDEKYTR